MFDKGEIARQSLQRANEIKTSKKSAKRRAAVVAGACAVGLGAFFFMFSAGILLGNGGPAFIDIDEPGIPLAASPLDIETQTENNKVICIVCKVELDEADEYDYLE